MGYKAEPEKILTMPKYEKGLKQGSDKGFHLSIPIIKELLKGELTHEEIAERFSISVQLVAKLAADLNRNL